MADGGSMDFKQLHMVVGHHRVDGRASGESLSCIWNREQFTESVGVDGIGYWNVSADLSGRFLIALSPASDSNDILFGFWRADITTPGGLMVPVSLIDGNGRTVIAAAKARVLKPADMVWGDGTVVRSWTLGSTRIEPLFLGGMNETPVAGA